MDTKQLIEEAESLKQPSAEVAQEFDQRREQLAAEIHRRMLERPDLETLIGSLEHREMMGNNCQNMTRFMGTMFTAYDPAAFVHTVEWVFRAYRSHGFSTLYWSAKLDTFIEVARGGLTEGAFGAIRPYFEWLIVHTPAFVALIDAAVSADAAD